MSLRHDLLRSLAQKEIRSKSLQKISEEKKPPAEESYNKHRTRRRSTLVTDVITAVSPNHHEHKPGERKASLVSDVIKSDPNTAGRRGSLAGTQANSDKPTPGKLETAKPHAKAGPVRMPGGRESRIKEISKLKYTSAARAAKMAFKEAHISMQANRRLSLQGQDHYITMQCVERMYELEEKKNKMDKNTSAGTKYKNWQKKFQMVLNTDS